MSSSADPCVTLGAGCRKEVTGRDEVLQHISTQLMVFTCLYSNNYVAAKYHLLH